MCKILRRLLLPSLLILVLAGCLAEPRQSLIAGGTGELTVELSGLRSDRGQVLVSLFRSSRGFPEKTGGEVVTLAAPVLHHRAQVRFPGLSYGPYAVSVLHDENGNGRMDSNWLGVPTEGHGASNNPQKRFGPPAFEQARFLLDRGELRLTVRVAYAGRKRPTGSPAL